MKAKGIIAVLAIAGLLVFVAVSVFGGNKDKVASIRTFDTKGKEAPGQINYQGYLVDSSDSSAITDTLGMGFSIWNQPVGDSMLWSEAHPQVRVENGLFNVLLGIYTPFPDTIFTGQDLWLQTMVKGELLWPRKKLVSVPYAFHAKTVEEALHPQGDGDWNYWDNPPHMYAIPTGNIGIGTTEPTEKLEVVGGAKFSSVYDDNIWTYNATIKLNQNWNHNYLELSAYDQSYGNFIWTEDPGAGTGQGFGIVGGSHVAPFERFVVNTDSMFLGYCIKAGNGSGDTGGDGAGNLYVRGNVGIGTTSPRGKIHVFSSDDGVGVVDTVIGVCGEVGYSDDSDAGYAGYFKAGGVGGNIGVVAIADGATGPKIRANPNVGIWAASVGDFPMPDQPTGSWAGYFNGAVYVSGDVDMTGTISPVLHVDDVMRLEPRAAAPSYPSEGDMYMDSNDHKLKVYDGTTWQACW